MEFTESHPSRFVLAVAGLALAALVWLGVQGSSAGQAGPPAPERSSSAAEAEAAISRANLGAQMEAALGDAFGGVWFEPATARMHVGVTSPASRGAAETLAARTGLAELVALIPVDSTWAELLAAQRRWNERLADLFARAEVKTSVAPDWNAVRVVLGSEVALSRRAELEREASAAAVDVSIEVAPRSHFRLRPLARCDAFKASAAYCNPTIVAGVTIQRENGGLCTAGPAAMPQSHTKPTDTYVLTAGHCIANGGGNGKKWYAYPKGAKEEKEREQLGLAEQHINKEMDVGAIKVDNPGYWAAKGFTPVEPTIAPWEEAEPEPYAVKGQNKPMKEVETCFSGQTTGTSCGTIKETNQTIEGVEKLVEVEKATAAGGDSGAPWYTKAEPDKVEGTMVAEITGTGIFVFHSVEDSFQKLNEKYGLDLKLLTETNKTRHAFKLQAESAPVTLTGTQDAEEDVLVTTAGTLKCAEATYSGSASEKEVTEVEVTPVYSGCTVAGVSATVDVNGCKYRFKVTKLESTKREGSVDIVCPEAKEITATVTLFGTIKCTVHVPSQNELRTITYTNIGSGATREVTVDVNLAGIKYTHTAGTGFGACTTGSATNGTYETAATITGESGGSHVGVFTS